MSQSSFLQNIQNEKEYLKLHYKILNIPTPLQTQTANSASKARLENQQYNAQNIPQPKYGDRIIIHYTHERRFQRIKKAMHKLHDDFFKNTSVSEVKLIVGSRKRRNIAEERIYKRPQQYILQNIPKQVRIDLS